jgi:hypothetical protein
MAWLSAVGTVCLYSPGKIPSTHFCQRLSWPQVQNAPRRIKSMKNLKIPIGNRIRYLMACSAVTQPTTSSPTPHMTNIFGFVKWQGIPDQMSDYHLWRTTVFGCLILLSSFSGSFLCKKLRHVLSGYRFHRRIFTAHRMSISLHFYDRFYSASNITKYCKSLTFRAQSLCCEWLDQHYISHRTAPRLLKGGVLEDIKCVKLRDFIFSDLLRTNRYLKLYPWSEWLILVLGLLPSV